MKKVAVTLLSIVGGIAVLAAAAFGGYEANENGFKIPWPETSASTDSDAPDQTISSASGSLSAKVSGGTVFGANGIRKSVAKGATKTVTFTVSPATATDKYVIVATSDATKVSVSSTKVLSGTAVTLTLVNGEFNGTVSITAHPEALPASVVTIPVTVYNFIKTLSFEACVISDENSSSDVLRDYVGQGNPVCREIDGDDSGYYDGVYVGVSGSLALTVSSPHYGVDVSTRAYLILTAAARDATILPSSIGASLAASTLPSWAVQDYYYPDSKAYVEYCVELNTTSGSALSFAFEDASVSFATSAYVAPSGLAGDVGGVQFK